jgi:hypothetical protein
MNSRCRVVIFLIALASSPLLLRADEPAERPTSATVTSGPVTVTSSIDKTIASVAEPIHLKLSVEAPHGTRIEWPSLGKKLGDMDMTQIAKSNDVPSAASTNLREWVLQLTLESIKTGDLTIPALDVRYSTDSKVETQTIQSSPLQIHIASVLEDRPDPTRFRDIKQTVDVPVSPAASRAWMVWTGGIATAVALLLAVVVARRRTRGPAPADWALASIEDLEQRKIHESDTTGLFNDVVAIVRQYIELEFGVAALSRTTDEFFSNVVHEIELPPATTKRLKWLASVADEIKFARLGIVDQHFEQAVVQAKAFVAECDQLRRAIAKGAA